MQDAKCMWHPNLSRKENVYVAFQTQIEIEQDDFFMIRMFGSNAYRAHIDGTEIVEGPARFESGHPEYDECSLELKQGNHIISVIVHYFGVSTRFAAPETPPFFQCELRAALSAIPLQWRCKEIDAYVHTHRRVNAQLGWSEFCDTRLMPQLATIQWNDDWLEPMEVKVDLGDYRPKSISDCHSIPVAGKLLAEGQYNDRFGYMEDDPPVRFMLRDRIPGLPAEGIWFRFDLERIGLYRPVITLDVPDGTVVEAGYSETLMNGRVIPFITLSGGASCHMDRWITKDGQQVLQTFSPRGFRFVELHIAASIDQVKQVSVVGVQRTYFDQLVGSFHCSDSLLNEIWMMGAHTLQACSEDALTDTPTRERGQWLGDAVAVGLETISVSFGDLSLIRRSLLQASYCCRNDGMVSGLYPGQNLYVSSYALLWISGCMRYYSKTGDRTLLVEVYDTAVNTIAVFMSKITPRGVWKPDCWEFIDWGHVVSEGDINVALNLFLLAALRDMANWERELGYGDAYLQSVNKAQKVEQIIKETYYNADGLLAESVPFDEELLPKKLIPGYHAAVLALSLELLEGDQIVKAVEFVKQHILHCFPNDIDAPRLAHPAANHRRIITPYFSHFALHALWEAGEADFVLEQYRVCWGWMKEQGATTLLEVFDPRWSQCHAWSGCPTWQLSGHILGLLPDESGDPTCFYWNPKPGSLMYAEGQLPIDNGKGRIDIKWYREGQEDSWVYELFSNLPIKLRLVGKWRWMSVVSDGIAQDEKTNVICLQSTLSIQFKSLRQKDKRTDGLNAKKFCSKKL